MLSRFVLSSWFVIMVSFETRSFMVNIEMIMFINESTMNENCVIDNKAANHSSTRVSNHSRFAATINAILKYFK